MLQILEPQDAGGVAGHAPVTTGREADTADLGAIGQTGTLELLGEETAAEGLKPLLDNLFVVETGESFGGHAENLGRTEAKAQEIIQEEVVQLVRSHQVFGLLTDIALLVGGYQLR